MVRQQDSTESITVTAPDADYPRPDIFVGKADGTIEYRAGTIDEEGNAQDPSYDPTTEVLLVAVTRNPDLSNDEDGGSAGTSSFVSKVATGTEVMQGSLAIGSLADPDNPSNLIQVDPNGKIIIVRADRYGSFATRNLAVGYSRLARITTAISGGVSIRDYQFTLDILATLDGDITQRGQLYCALINDGTGVYVSSVLEVTGSLNPDVFTLVKVSATEYDLFYEHLDTKAILIYRPFALGPADRYIFYRRETILASLPAGDQYNFSLYGDLSEILSDIAALETWAMDLDNQVQDHEKRIEGLEMNSGPSLPPGGTTGQVLKKQSAADGDADWEDEAGGGASAFLDLTDVDAPSGYTGQALKVPRVKADESGLELVDAPSGEPSGLINLGDVSGLISLDLTSGNRFKCRLIANGTLTFTGAELGKDYVLEITREGNFTLAYQSGKFRLPLGYVPVLTNTTTNGTSPPKAVDLLTLLCMSENRLDIVVTPDIREN